MRSSSKNNNSPPLIDKKLVNVDISIEESKKTGNIQVTDHYQKWISTLEISVKDSKTIYLSGSQFPFPIELKEDHGCFSHVEPLSVLLCYNPDGFLLEINDAQRLLGYTLSADKSQTPLTPPIHAPTRLNLTEAIKLLFQKNFDSRIAFEHAIQAKHYARIAFLNLLPHLTFSNVLTNLNPTLTSLLGSIGDLAPFIFPNRWFKAYEGTLKSNAEKYALKIMQADLALQLEALTFSLERDRGIYALYNRFINILSEAREKIILLENSDQIQKGSIDHIDSLINSLSLDIANLGLIIREDKLSIGQLLGFQDPEIFEEVSLENELQTQPKPFTLHSEELLPLALFRSLELKQMDYLIEIATYQKKELYFSWFDPSEETNPFAFLTGDTIKVGLSRINELQIRREQIQSAISKSINTVVLNYNTETQTSDMIAHGLELHERRLKRELELIIPHSGMNVFDLQGIIADYLTEGIRYENHLANLRINLSKVNRFLLQGYYSELQTIQPEIVAFESNREESLCDLLNLHQ